MRRSPKGLGEIGRLLNDIDAVSRHLQRRHQTLDLPDPQHRLQALSTAVNKFEVGGGRVRALTARVRGRPTGLDLFLLPSIDREVG